MAYLDKMSESVKAAFYAYVSYISGVEGVKSIYLFGSYAYGEPTEDSDIDLYVVIEDGLSAKKLMLQFGRGLSDRVVPLDILVDTVSGFEAYSVPSCPTIEREVKEKGVLVYGK